MRESWDQLPPGWIGTSSGAWRTRRLTGAAARRVGSDLGERARLLPVWLLGAPAPLSGDIGRGGRRGRNVGERAATGGARSQADAPTETA
jgi:hypothetical protein